MRMKRLKTDGEGYYHLMSRCALKQFLFNDVEKQAFCAMLRRVAAFSGIEVLTYCVMSNHFHLLVHVPRPQEIDESELLRRVGLLYGQERENAMRERWNQYRKFGWKRLLEKEHSQLRARMGDISPFMQILKQRFTIWYRARTPGHEGTLWQGRFTSTLVEGGGSLVAVGAYIDLNPVRAGIVSDPKDYRFSGYGAAISGDATAQAGLCELYGDSPQPFQKVAEAYRALLYLKGSASMSPEEVRQVLKKRGHLPLPQLLRCRVRALNSGLAIGSKKFVAGIFATHRYAFSERRKHVATGENLCPSWDGIQLCSVRKLRKQPITFSN